MTSRSKRNIREQLVEQTGDENLLFADGLDKAILGVCFDFEEPRVVYSKQAIVKCLMSSNKLSFEDAYEYAEYNVYTAYVGKRTPIYVEVPKFKMRVH